MQWDTPGVFAAAVAWQAGKVPDAVLREFISSGLITYSVEQNFKKNKKLQSKASKDKNQWWHSLLRNTHVKAAVKTATLCLSTLGFRKLAI